MATVAVCYIRPTPPRFERYDLDGGDLPSGDGISMLPCTWKDIINRGWVKMDA
jgi:hypothetical protein